MLLPRGITEQGGANYRAFRGHCYEAARSVGGKVELVETPRAGLLCNYSLAIIRIRDDSTAVALNDNFPWLAFATPPRSLWLDFIDHPIWAAEFQRIGGYHLCSAADMRQFPTPEILQDLGPKERKEVQYYRSKRVGDVVFNFWD